METSSASNIPRGVSITLRSRAGATARLAGDMLAVVHIVTALQHQGWEYVRLEEETYMLAEPMRYPKD